MKSFINYSEKIGKNFLLCQGPGGNTSIKFDKSILIKKSGSFLRKKVTELPVDLKNDPPDGDFSLFHEKFLKLKTFSKMIFFGKIDFIKKKISRKVKLVF